MVEIEVRRRRVAPRAVGRRDGVPPVPRQDERVAGAQRHGLLFSDAAVVVARDAPRRPLQITVGRVRHRPGPLAVQAHVAVREGVSM